MNRISRLQSKGYEIQVKDTQLKMKNNLGSREEGDNPIFQLVILVASEKFDNNGTEKSAGSEQE